MYIATGLTDVVTFCATPAELAPENREQISKKIAGQRPVVFGSDVIADMGAKVHFVGEPTYEMREDTLIVCTIHVKLTVNKHIAATAGLPEEEERDFVAYAKCSESDKENYDPEFGKRIAMNKAKINAYTYYMRLFVRNIERIHHNLVAMVGFTKKMENLVNGNAKYIFNLCEEKYPGEHAEQQADGENPPMKEENPEAPVPGNVVPMSASVAADVAN